MSEVNGVTSRLTRPLGSGTLEAIACSAPDPDSAIGETPREHNQGETEQWRRSGLPWRKPW